MKKNSLIYTIISFFSILFFFSCDLLTNTPKEPSLPAITTVGAGTFGCMVNGELYLPHGRSILPFSPNPDASFTEQSGSLRLWIGNDIVKQTYIYIYIGGINGMGMYKNFLLEEAFLDFSLTGCEKYKHFGSFDDFLEISFLDMDEDIISGTFEMTLVNDCDNSDTLRITDGRFDLEYTL